MRKTIVQFYVQMQDKKLVQFIQNVDPTICGIEDSRMRHTKTFAIKSETAKELNEHIEKIKETYLTMIDDKYEVSSVKHLIISEEDVEGESD